jgi:thermitase
MNDETAQIQPRSQSFWQKLKTSKKYKFLLFGIVFLLFLSAIIYIGSSDIEEENGPIPPTVTPTPPAPRVEDQIILKFKPGVSEQAINENLKKYSATIIKRIDAINRLVIQVPKGQEDAILSELKKDNLIEAAEPDYINKAFFVPSDPSLNVQYGLANTGQVIKGQQGTAHADINAEVAWDITRGNGVKIAILDTGIDANHPDLSGKIVAQKDFIGGAASANDNFGHGTHTAGIAAASTNNSIGISGMCPDCQLIIGKVLDDQGSGPDSTIIDGITWAADNGAKVISMSFGGTGNSTAKQAAIDYAWGKGAVLVASAGNTGQTGKNYPGANTKVVSVAATDNKDQKASFSTYGTWVSVAAPGKSIYSTLPTHAYNLQQTKNTNLNYDYLDGTSMSCPMVAGVVGLIWASSYGTSNTAVVQRLYDTADKITGTGQYWVNGRVNAGLAVAGSASVTPTAAATPIPSGSIIPTSTPAPTSQPVPTSGPTAGPTYPIPTLYCIGSCPTPPVTPTAGIPYGQPSENPLPTDNTLPTSEVPTIAVPTTIQQPTQGQRKSFLRRIRDMIRSIWQIILQFLQQLLRQLRIGS